MLMRAVMYARYSTDLQNITSIADQFAVCRRFAERSDLVVVSSFDDAALSAASMANRPGLRALMKAAAEGQFDIVLCEALDRLSRSQADVAAIFEDLRFHGVKIRTLAEGDISELQIGMMGTMNALQLQEIRRKTRRGLEGVARDGRHTGGRVYGYRIHREEDASGERIRGLRAIEPAQAAVVLEIYRRYSAGASPRAIANLLNARGLPGPRGGRWNASTINGNAERGNGIIHNELYRGVWVFGRQTWVKDRQTGTRRARTGDAANIIRTEVPHLRIVPEALWIQARERYAQNKLGPNKSSSLASVRPRHLLSGKLSCGVCGGPMIRSGADQRFVCSWRRERGASICSNGRGAKGAEIEKRVLAAIKTQLLSPERVALAVDEARKALEHESQRTTQERSNQESRLAEVKRRANRLIDQVADGVLSGAAVKERLTALEEERAALETQLAQTDKKPVIALHPRLADQYRQVVASLEDALHRSDSEASAEARDLVRRLIETVVVTPLPERGKFALTVKGKIAALVNQDGDGTVVLGAGAGFEPATFRL